MTISKYTSQKNLIKIFQELDITTLTNIIPSVCQYFYQLSSLDVVWISIFAKERFSLLPKPSMNWKSWTLKTSNGWTLNMISKIKNSVMLKNKMHTAIAIDRTDIHKVILGNRSFSSSEIYYWEVYIGKIPTRMNTKGDNTWKMQGEDACVGVGIGCKEVNRDQFLGYDNFAGGYYNCGSMGFRGELKTYGEPYEEGDKIGVVLDLVKRYMSFFKNEKFQGIAYVSLPKKDFFPAVSVRTIKSEVTIYSNLPDLEVPQDYHEFFKTNPYYE